MPNIPPIAPPKREIAKAKTEEKEKLMPPDAIEPERKRIRKYKIPASAPFKSPLFKTCLDI